MSCEDIVAPFAGMTRIRFGRSAATSRPLSPVSGLPWTGGATLWQWTALAHPVRIYREGLEGDTPSYDPELARLCTMFGWGNAAVCGFPGRLILVLHRGGDQLMHWVTAKSAHRGLQCGDPSRHCERPVV
jgi:hypothetical protein